MGYSRFIKLLHFLGDLFLLNFSFMLIYSIKFNMFPLRSYNDHYVSLHLVFNLVWIILVVFLKIYQIERTTNIANILWDIFYSISLHSLIIGTYIFSIRGFYYSRGHLFFAYLVFS